MQSIIQRNEAAVRLQPAPLARTGRALISATISALSSDGSTMPSTMSTKHARLIILGSGPAGLHRGSIRGACQSEAGADHRSRAGRPADDDHRCRQLAGGRRRRAGPGSDGALPEARRALRDRDRLRPDPHGAPARAPDAPDRRQRRIHLRRADHRDRRVRALPRPAVRGGVHGQGRVRLRDLRRLLLQGPGRRRGRRRQHRRRGSALPVEHREATSPWSIAATSSAPRRS